VGLSDVVLERRRSRAAPKRYHGDPHCWGLQLTGHGRSKCDQAVGRCERERA
jgi:hypothetical protein